MSDYSIKINSATDITSVISAHMAWKRRIQAAIDGEPDNSISIETVMADNQCVLGKWIYGDGQKFFEKDADFIQLKAIHTIFHQVTANALEMVKNEQIAEAQEIISKGEFTVISKEVINLLTVLYRRYK